MKDFRELIGTVTVVMPIECFYAQGFPKNYKLPTDMSDSRLYKQAGNSVAVPVIERIAKNIIDALMENDIEE